MTNHAPRAPRALTREALDSLAIHYVAKYATTRATLIQYLRRKLRERGWEGDTPPPIEAVADRLVELRYIDDAAFAQGRADALLRRGYGERRIDAALRVAGVADVERTRDPNHEWQAALAFAKRRRIGPFAAVKSDRDGARKAMAAMLRAGHASLAIRRIVDAEPGIIPDQVEST